MQTYCDDIPPSDGSWLRVIVEKPFGNDLQVGHRAWFLFCRRGPSSAHCRATCLAVCTPSKDVGCSFCSLPHHPHRKLPRTTSQQPHWKPTPSPTHPLISSPPLFFKSSEELSDMLGKLYPEKQLYRIDHYLVRRLTVMLV